MRELNRMHRIAHQRFDKFVASGACQVLEKSNGRKAYRPESHDHCEEFGKLTGNLDTMHVAGRLIPQSFLVCLVSQYDAFIRSLFGTLLLNNRNILKGSNKNLEISTLLSFATINEAYEWLVEQEVDSTMRKSHSDQFDFVETMFAVEWQRKEDPLWRSFVEVTERRNLFTHTDGLVSDQYLKICAENAVQLEAVVVKGSLLTATDEYFRRAYETLLEMGIKLCQVLWRKHLPDQLELADQSLQEIILDLLKTGRTHLAKNLLVFLTSTLKSKVHHQDVLLVGKVNLAIALKELGDRRGFATCLASEDWDQKDPKFQLAEAVLQERHHQAVELMRKVGAGIHKADYRSWPLFKGFRDSAEFQSVFEEVFGEPFVAQSHPEHGPKAIIDETFPTEPPTRNDTGESASEGDDPTGRPN